MATRQAGNQNNPSASDDTGRAAQRRRTRAAIVGATTRLVAGGLTPSVDDIAAEADVSRRTVYMYFPTLDQLLLDATVGALTAATTREAPTNKGDADDPTARVDALVRSLTRGAAATLPLGRKIIALTVDAPGPSRAGDGDGAPRRGYRRLEWIREAVEPMRASLTKEQYERLVSALSVIIGWEAMIVLRDVDGLGPRREDQVMRWAARAIVEAMLAEVTPE